MEVWRKVLTPVENSSCLLRNLDNQLNEINVVVLAGVNQIV
jgi:hypothetical protein